MHGAMVEVRPGLRGFRIERWMGDERAADIEFIVEARDGAFRVTLDRIALRYSRAKVADMGWHNWWTRIPLIYGLAFDVARIFGTEYGDGAVDVQINVQFSTSWTDADGENHFAPLAALGWTVLDVALGGEPHTVRQSSGWLPFILLAICDLSGDVPSYGRGRILLSTLVTEQDEMSPQFFVDLDSLSQFFDAVLSRLPIPGF